MWVYVVGGLVLVWAVWNELEKAKAKFQAAPGEFAAWASDTALPSADSATKEQREANPVGSATSDGLDWLAEKWGWLSTVPTQIKAAI